MRIAWLAAQLLWCLPLLGSDANLNVAVSIEKGAPPAESVVDAHQADAKWREALERASVEKKPIVIFFGTPACERCNDFERLSVPHPAIARRLPSVVFAMLPATAGEAARSWGSGGAGVALFDRTGVLRVRWPLVPDTTTFGILLDSIVEVAPHFEEAARRIEAGAPRRGDLEAALGIQRLGHPATARTTLARAAEDDDRETRQRATIALAVLDANDGKTAAALKALQEVLANAATPRVLAEASMAIGATQRALGAIEDAIRAYSAVDESSAHHAAAKKIVEELRVARAQPALSPIRILPLDRQLVTGRQTVRTHVSSDAVARVTFFADGREVRRADRPPFSARVDFGAVPERHTIRAVASDRRGREIGRDERVFNEAGETFWLRIVSPRAGSADGSVRVSVNVRVPAARRVQRVAVSWNDAERAVLTNAPWEATVRIPEGQLGVLRAVAELEDGRTSEDAVLLNAGGVVARADVQLVELPLTIAGEGTIAPERIVVREGDRVRQVESIATAAETPLTVGMIVDVSGSMQKTLPDLQEAAIRFLETMLGPRDRAFVVAFDTRARLVQPATSDTALLRRQIMALRPDGLTALHDAMVLGLLQFEGIKGRRAMIVFSDGHDVTSRYGTDDVSELARRVNVPIHVISAVQGVPAGTASNVDPTDRELKSVAQSTGGTGHTLGDLTELRDVYARVERVLRAQLLAFIRTDPATRDHEWRRIRVEVEGMTVHAPEGYYASW